MRCDAMRARAVRRDRNRSEGEKRGGGWRCACEREGGGERGKKGKGEELGDGWRLPCRC